MIGEAGRGDAGAFLARLLKLDPAALVRVRPARLYPGPPGLPGLVEMWAMLPFGVLVVRLVSSAGGTVPDVTVAAKELLDSLSEPGAPRPRRRDEAWRWPLPTTTGRAIETIPEAEVGRIAVAASRTLRQASVEGLGGGRRVGERVMRDALLDHVPIVVTDTEGDRIDVPQRLVQAVVRMGFLRISAGAPETHLTQGDTSITVRSAGRWISLDCSYGSAWYLPISPLRLS